MDPEKFDKMAGMMDNIETKAHQLTRVIARFGNRIQHCGVTEIKGLQVLFIEQKFSRCLRAMEKMYELFGYDIRDDIDSGTQT